ncbi:MAG: HAMP domain-containing histidine kinase [Chloroflexi bacterium]|nr:MAG: HAMP domain-containing histidine kinase [Chloroflexota bacterium]
MGAPTGTFAELLDSSGKVVGTPVLLGSDLIDSATHPVLPSSLPADKTFLTVDGTGSVHHYRIYVDNSDDVPGDTIVAAIPLDTVDSTLGRLLLFEIAISGGITLIVVTATWIMVRRGLRPLERMGATARSIAASDLSRRVTPSSSATEVGRLGLALNTMLGQLEQVFAERAAGEQRLRHFVSDASHELRTPLTSMRGYAELLQRNPDMSREDYALALRRIEGEAARMGILVDDLLLLARLDQGRPLERNHVDLEALVKDACADARAADGTRMISAHVSAPLQVVGDDLRLRQVVSNLLRNALVHTPPGTPIEVDLSAADGRAVIDVIDHGPGIPPGQKERIFERFHRAEPDRSRDRGGSGLGLSIATAVVAAHGGRISVSETTGGGATFRIELPRVGAVQAADR